MNTTPLANRKHIAVFGYMNSGKSSIINVLTGQNVSIVSSVPGTTTDPVKKAMELTGYGPVVFIDTAGLDDSGDLGLMRIQKSKDILKETDLAIYVIDAEKDNAISDEMVKLFRHTSTPYITVINKTDKAAEEKLEELRQAIPGAIEVSALKNTGIDNLRTKIAELLREDHEEETLVGDLLPAGSKVILVVPIDSGAPKGRLILPQVQVIRDCLDHGIKSYVVRDTELASALEDMPDADLVITDSQAFNRVNSVVPANIYLTSFSMLFAHLKGDFDEFIRGASMVDRLKPDSRILIAESCTHNHTHEDIGRVKIPRLLNKYTGYQLEYDFCAGRDFAKDVTSYDLVIHCGACMVNKKALKSRIADCVNQGIPITNYGIILSKLNGILDRTIEIFAQKKTADVTVQDKD
ncbi:MAG: [FeFe] hydrogenase H-cluster maturation GTPase HydF [Clostridiaceae bacterium]|nr:[FeFe] hydrogenase H-cluster maturation GTPase HydF [Clostridiaceae bacterium]